ncbi:MAG TPA: hypothetical protein DEP05_05915 [Betaproteobacteria bacterium]|nr:hypothetical protein [Betaproteobacteria bacterium]
MTGSRRPSAAPGGFSGNARPVSSPPREGRGRALREHPESTARNANANGDKADRLLRELEFRLTGGNYSLTLNAAASAAAFKDDMSDTGSVKKHAE